MADNKRTLAKLDVGAEDLYLLATALGADGEEGFELTLCDGEHGWTGSLDENDLETLSNEVKMDYSEYVNQTKKAFSRINLGSLNFVYQTKKQKDGSLILSWKKHIMAENIKFQLGTVKLVASRDPKDVILTLFNEALAVTSELQSAIHTLQADNDRMVDERSKALKRLEKCANMKEDVENDLYAKFVVVVNDKKAKIRELKAEVDELRKEGGSKRSTVQSGRVSGSAAASTSNNHATTSRHDANDTDEEDVSAGVASDYETDEDKPTPPKRTGRPGKQAVKLKAEPESQDESLILDAGDDAVLPSTGKRRRREATKKSSPAKAVLPKVSSTPKTTPASTSRAGRRTSMRKAASNTSNVSSEQLDADDMIDDMF